MQILAGAPLHEIFQTRTLHQMCTTYLQLSAATWCHVAYTAWVGMEAYASGPMNVWKAICGQHVSFSPGVYDGLIMLSGAP